MKREQLLEAIGGVDEALLMETEQTAHHSSGKLRRFVLAAAIVAILAVTVAASSSVLPGILKAGKNGSAVSNLSTGMGSYVYTEEGIYYGKPGYIYWYDLEGNLVKTYPLSDKYETPYYMFATEDAIVYVNSRGLAVESEDPNREEHWGLRVQPKDGSEPFSVCPGVEAIHAYADGNQLYTNNGGTMLSRIDLVTFAQTDLLENVYSYFVDDTYIYAIQNGNGKWYFRSRKDNISFEQINLDFDPNKIIADGEDLYICEWMNEEEQKATGHRYRVNLVRDGKTTHLPIYSWFYQILDGCVLYLEEETYSLKCYNISTGEVTTLAENVFEFSVLGGRYICIDRFNTDPEIYDWQTGERTRLEAKK